MPDADTSSANPQALLAYAESADRIAGELERTSIRLAGALDEFAATCREYPLGIDGSLADLLRGHARRQVEQDQWVRRVAEQFQLADRSAVVGGGVPGLGGSTSGNPLLDPIGVLLRIVLRQLPPDRAAQASVFADSGDVATALNVAGVWPGDEDRQVAAAVGESTPLDVLGQPGDSALESLQRGWLDVEQYVASFGLPNPMDGLGALVSTVSNVTDQVNLPRNMARWMAGSDQLAAEYAAGGGLQLEAELRPLALRIAQGTADADDYRRAEEIGNRLNALTSSANSNSRAYSERVIAAADRNPDLWKYEAAVEGPAAIAAMFIAPSTQVGLLRNAVAAALDPALPMANTGFRALGGFAESLAHARLSAQATVGFASGADAVSRLLSKLPTPIAEKILGEAAVAARRTGLSEPLMQRSIVKAAQSSKAAESVGGMIEYGRIDELGRPTGIRATITEGMTRRGFGTKADGDLIPPGYVGAHQPPFGRGHLLGRQLGGDGGVYQNLVTLYQNDVNTPLMSDIERQVRIAIESGQRVTYEVTPIYDGAQAMPARVHIRARGEVVAGSGEALIIDTTIENVPKSLPKLTVELPPLP